MDKPLQGLKIIDFTHVQAGPACTQLLAWFGADVIKIEDPGPGDYARAMGPVRNEVSQFFVAVNRGTLTQLTRDQLQGVIAHGNEASADNIVAGLRAAFENTSTAGVVLRINSPGGSPVQAGMIVDEMVRLRKGYPGKPLYVVVDEICASGCYYIAAGADRIYVNKASIIGSIGVLMDGFGFTGIMDKVGVERRLMTAGANKGMLDPFSPRNTQHEGFAQAMLDQIHQQFIGVVRPAVATVCMKPPRCSADCSGLVSRP